MSRTSNWGAYWFRKNGRKWDRKFFNEQPWCGGGGVNRWDLFKQNNNETKSAWIGTALQRGQLVIWWIWILAPHHVWAPHSLLHHFLCRPPCSRDEVSTNEAARTWRWFWGENLLQGKRDAQHERVGTAEHDLSPCEARGWVWGSQASVDKLLGSRSVQSFYAWRWRAKEIYKWDEGNGRKICKRFASEKTTFMWGLGTNWMITSKHLSIWDEAALGRIGGSF